MEVAPGSKKNIPQDGDFNTNGRPKYRRHMKDLRRPGFAMQHGWEGLALPEIVAPTSDRVGGHLRQKMNLASIYGDIGCLLGTAGSNGYGPNPIQQAKRAGRSSLTISPPPVRSPS
jgi:hypothetical protein